MCERIVCEHYINTLYIFFIVYKCSNPEIMFCVIQDCANECVDVLGARSFTGEWGESKEGLCGVRLEFDGLSVYICDF